MDILLTPEQIEAVGWVAVDDWDEQGESRKYPADSEEYRNAFRAFCDARLCRAQVRQFHLWLMTHWQSAKKLDGAVQLTISEADWAALKAAGEGR